VNKLAFAVGALVALLAPLAASATPNFPPAIQSYLPTPSSPPCQICHVGPQQLGTVRTAFGTAMRTRGLVAFDEGSLHSALDRMAADKVDSDGDGETDVDALKEGKDPNGSGAQLAGPEYGCGVARVEDAWMVLVGLVVAFSRRRGRRPGTTS
jgi:hypothetical protein